MQVGKAKRNIMQKKYDEEMNQQFDWDNLARRVNNEREVEGYPEGTLLIVRTLARCS